jgi:hypothetical protein
MGVCVKEGYRFKAFDWRKAFCQDRNKPGVGVKVGV